MNRGLERWLKLRRVFGLSIGVRSWRVKRWDGELMDVNVGVGSDVPTLVTAAGLADVSGCADVVDRDVVGGDEPGEVEELAQVALGEKWYHHYGYLTILCHCSYS